MLPQRFSLRSHLAAFVAGAIVATAIAAHAIPNSEKNAARYAALDTFAQALSYISNNYVEPVDERKLMHGAIHGMVEKLDNNSVFLSPKRYKRLRQDTEGEFGGVGISLDYPPNPDNEGPGYPVIETVIRNSPAARAGIVERDRLVSVNGAMTATSERRTKPKIWHSRLRGRSGTHVTIEVKRKSWDKPRKFVLVRERIKVPTVEWLAVEKNIGYIAIRKFQEATAADVQKALEALKPNGLSGLILDLRGNPGGILDQAVRVADLFIGGGTILTIRGRSGGRMERKAAHRAGTWGDVRVLVLIDGESASAAEIVAGALQDHRRGIVVGLPSFGKGSIQTFMDLADGSGLKLTTAKYYTPKGRSLEGTGITPDIYVGPFGLGDSGTDSDPEDGGSDRQSESGEVNSKNGASLAKQLQGDHQFRFARQTVQGWFGSK